FTHMPHPSPRILIPIAVIAALAYGGWYVERQRAQTRAMLSGFFESQPAELSPRIPGRVRRIYVREGDSVRSGQPLLELEVEPNRAEYVSKQALARQAAANLQEVRAGPRPEEKPR